MSDKIAKKQYGTAQNALGTTVTVNDVTYNIIGIYKARGNIQVMVNQNPYGADLLVPDSLYINGEGATRGNTLKLTFSQGVNASSISRKVAKYLKKNGPARNQGTYEYIDMEKALKQFSSQMRIITTFISFIAAISLFIAGIGVMNMMYISVSERTQEIGIRLALAQHRLTL